MMTVTVKVIMDMAEKMGGNEHVMDLPDGTNLNDLLDFLEQKYNIPFRDLIQTDKGTEYAPGVQRSGKILLLLNGRNLIFLDGLNTKIQNGDDLFFLSPIGGG